MNELTDKIEVDKRKLLPVCDGLYLYMPERTFTIASKLIINGAFKKQILAMRKIYYKEMQKHLKAQIKAGKDLPVKL